MTSPIPSIQLIEQQPRISNLDQGQMQQLLPPPQQQQSMPIASATTLQQQQQSALQQSQQRVYHAINHQRSSAPSQAQVSYDSDSDGEFNMDDLDPGAYFLGNRCGRLVLFAAKWLMKSVGIFLVAAAMTLFMLFIAFWFYVAVPLLTHDGAAWRQILHIGAGVIVSFNLLFNYIKCVITNPGYPPEEWLNQARLSAYRPGMDTQSEPTAVAAAAGPVASMQDEDQLDVATSSESGQHEHRWSTFCKKCEEPKPVRTHHCHICDRCVLRMDHHCPWINNCVGYYNHRYFILFLFYLWLGTLYISVVFGLVFVQQISYDRDMYWEWSNSITFACILSISIMATMSGFLGWHLYLVCTNQTTIEFQFNKLRYFQNWRRRGQLLLNEFDLGLRRNLEQIFGSKPIIFFLLPSTSKLPLNGCSFPSLRHLRTTRQLDSV